MRELSITWCELKHEQLKALSDGIIDNGTINILDLSHNLLGIPVADEGREWANCRSGVLAGKIISRSCERRNKLIYHYSIKGNLPPEDPITQGLVEINLEHNHIDDSFVHEFIKHYFKFDTWIRVSSVSHFFSSLIDSH